MWPFCIGLCQFRQDRKGTMHMNGSEANKEASSGWIILVLVILAIVMYFAPHFVNNEAKEDKAIPASPVTVTYPRLDVYTNGVGVVVTNVSTTTLVALVDLNAIRASLVRRKAEADKKAEAGVEETFSPEKNGVISVDNVSVSR